MYEVVTNHAGNVWNTYLKKTCISLHVIVCVCVGGMGKGGGIPACARGCVLTIQQMGTSDAEILNTVRFETLLRDDVHLDNFMYLIIARMPGDSYRKRFRSQFLCLLLCVCGFCRLLLVLSLFVK